MDETNEPIQPVPEQPPEQEHQTMNPDQHGQIRDDQNPPEAGVSSQEAIAGRKAEQEETEITGGTTIDELVKNAYFLADSLGEPEVSAISPTQIQLYYPEDESMLIIRLEARRGRWGGIAPIGSERDAERWNKSFDEQKKVLEEKKAAAKEAAEPQPAKV